MTDVTTPKQRFLHRNLAEKGDARHDDRMRRLDSASKPPTKATPGVVKWCLLGVYMHRFTSSKRLTEQGFFEAWCRKCSYYILLKRKQRIDSIQVDKRKKIENTRKPTSTTPCAVHHEVQVQFEHKKRSARRGLTSCASVVICRCEDSDGSHWLGTDFPALCTVQILCG